MSTQRRFHGVSLHKKLGLWKARYVRQDGQRVWLSDKFATDEEAARAYDAAVLKDGLPAQSLNFVSRDSSAEGSSLTSIRSSLAGLQVQIKAEKAKGGKMVPEEQQDEQQQSKKRKLSDSEVDENISGAKKGKEEEWQDAKTTTKKKKKKEKQHQQHQDKLQKAAAAVVAAKAKPGTAGKFDAEKTTKRLGFRHCLQLDLVKSLWVRNVASLVEVCYAHPLFEKYYDTLINKLDKRMDGWTSTSDILNPTAAFSVDAKTDTPDETNATGKTPKVVKQKQPKVYAIDCEMVLCAPVGSGDGAASKSTLARVSLVECVRGEPNKKPKYAVVLDEFVQTPRGLEVTDYLTHISGVTAEHLGKATRTHEKIADKIRSMIKPWDLLVGHGLQADFEVLKVWHGNFVDSAFLCGVFALPNLTLSLKDVATAVLKHRVGDFHKAGRSHDSVEDAQWAVNVVLRLLEMRDSDKKHPIPYLLNDIPERHKSRLTFHLIPDGVTTEQVQAFIEAHLPEQEEQNVEMEKKEQGGDKDATSFSLTAIRWGKRRVNDKIGSCTAEFPTPQTAKAVFNALSAASSGCGGYANSGPCYPSGFPDRQGMRRKLVDLSKQEQICKKGSYCEVICYFPIQLSHKKVVSIKSNHFGQVIGKAGSVLTLIQQTTGARVTVLRQPDRSLNTNKLLCATGEFCAEADAPTKVEAAVAKIHKASRKELFLV